MTEPNPTPTPAPEPAPSGDPAPAAKPFYADIADEELRGWAENKKFPDAQAALTSYRALERTFGADRAGRTVVLPKEGDEVSQAEFYEKLGRPKTAGDYDIPVPEGGGDPKTVEWAKNVFHKAGLSAAQAKVVAAAWNEQAGQMTAAQMEEYNAKVAADDLMLTKEWGAAKDQKVQACRRAAGVLGMQKDQIDALEKAMGFGGLMKFMDNIASRIGEDKFDAGEDKGAGFGAMTPAGAKAALQELTLDSEFMKAWNDPRHPGHAAAVAKKSRLNGMAFPG